MAVLYPAPGNNGHITYGQGDVFGSAYEITNSLKNSAGWTLSGGVSAKEGVYSVGLDGAASDSFTTQQDTAQGVKIEKNRNYTLNLNSGSDDVNHEQDMFILWVDPDIELVQAGTRLTGNIDTTINGGKHDPLILVAALARQIRDRSFSPSQQKLLTRLTTEDFAEILKQDPAFTGAPLASLPDRYERLRSTLPVAGPARMGDPTLFSSLSISTTNTATSTSTGTVTSVTGDTNGFSLMNILFKRTNEVSYSHKTTRSASSAMANTITGQVGSTTVGFNKTFDVYLDKVFGTLAFGESELPQGARRSARGVVRGDPTIRLSCERPNHRDKKGNCVPPR